ncbi:hypothetical protein [Okeania sp. SIO3I5]|uniref:hypothetical protein n=1 Tax=Okeania sp. SIO3I5 TaxID=2607805 RepID=UPI0025EE9C46|nr:hypothetical protein [Okeania sp. SIO3I5]
MSKTGKPSSEVKGNWQQCRQLIEPRVAAGTINSEEDGWLYEQDLRTATISSRGEWHSPSTDSVLSRNLRKS